MEISIEEKARRYDEAYKKVAVRFGSNVADEIFSQFEMSEDERIRKAIKKALQVRCDGSRIISDEPVTLEEAIAWLEKQGEQNIVDKICKKANINPPYKDGNAWSILVGDNIQEGICGFGDTKEEALVEFIKELISTKQSEQKETPCDRCKKAQPSHSCSDIMALGRCYVEGEQNHAWSEEDETGLTNTIIMLKEGASLHFNKKDITKAVDWLKSLKERVQPKQEWNKEDESHIRNLIECLEYCKKGLALTMPTSTSQEYIDWLKFLRPQNRWKPSDEQMDALETAVSSLQSTALESLYNKLKKL